MWGKISFFLIALNSNKLDTCLSNHVLYVQHISRIEIEVDVTELGGFSVMSRARRRRQPVRRYKPRFYPPRLCIPIITVDLPDKG